MKQPSYLEDHRIEYNVEVGSLESEENNLGIAQPQTDAEDDNL